MALTKSGQYAYKAINSLGVGKIKATYHNNTTMANWQDHASQLYSASIATQKQGNTALYTALGVAAKAATKVINTLKRGADANDAITDYKAAIADVGYLII